MFRPLKPYQLATDLVVALLCLAVRTAIGYEDPAIAIVVLAMATALALRRLSPGLALGVAWVGAIVQMVAGHTPDVSNVAILAVLYATARHGIPTVKWLGLISAGVGALIAAVYMTFGTFFVPSTGPWYASPVFANAPQVVFVFSIWLFAAGAALILSWTLGLLVKTWRAGRDSRRRQAAAEQIVVIEQERNRIARDMHDVVAHSLAVVIAQADGARYARAKDPDSVDTALATISTTAREALSDVRLLLGQLRHNQEEGPQPVLADLGRLLDQVRASGLTIAFEQAGTPLALPASQQLAIYRIVQEALTNALRHGAKAEEAVLRMSWAEDSVEITVSNAVTSSPVVDPHLGHGLAGMRERALLVGGRLSAGLVDGRYVVHAELPVRAEGVA